MDILGSIINIASGGLTGIIGSAISAFSTYKLKKLEYEHQEKLIQLQSEAKKVDIEVTKAVVQGQVDIQNAKAFTESVKSQQLKYFSDKFYESLPDWFKPFIASAFALLDFVRGIVRPVITVYMLYLVTFLGYKTYEANPKAFTVSADIIVQSILYLASLSVSWWFGDRFVVKNVLEKNKK